MSSPGLRGLAPVSTDLLEALLRAVHRGNLSCPLVATELHAAGLSAVADCLDALRGLDDRGVKAVVAAVLAERERTR